MSNKYKLSRQEKYAAIMSRAEAAFLFKLVQVDGVRGDEEKIDGFFPCTEGFLSNANWSKAEQDRCFRKLRLSGIVQTSRKPLKNYPTAVRWVRVDYDALDEKLDQFKASYGRVITRRSEAQIKNTVPTERKAIAVAQRASPARATRTSLPKPKKGATMLMPLVDIHPAQVSKLDPSEQDRKSAAALHEFVSRAGFARSDMRPSTWAAWFTKARAQWGDERVASVLKWYCAGKVTKFTIQAFCGESFYKKFLRLENKMNGIPEDTHPTVDITPEAKKAAARLARKGWSHACATQLEQFVQLSANAVYDFRCKIISALNRRDGTPATVFTLGVYVDLQLANAVPFAESWGERVYDSIKNWSGFNGNLLAYVWRPDHKMATADGHKWAAHKTGDPNSWNKLLKELDQ